MYWQGRVVANYQASGDGQVSVDSSEIILVESPSQQEELQGKWAIVRRRTGQHGRVPAEWIVPLEVCLANAESEASALLAQRETLETKLKVALDLTESLRSQLFQANAMVRLMQSGASPPGPPEEPPSPPPPPPPRAVLKPRQKTAAGSPGTTAIQTEKHPAGEGNTGSETMKVTGDDMNTDDDTNHPSDIVSAASSGEPLPRAVPNPLVPQPPSTIPTAAHRCLQLGRHTTHAHFGDISSVAFNSQSSLDDFWSWKDHINCTLFYFDTSRADAIGEHLQKFGESSFMIMSCRTKANRNYTIQCKHCMAFTFGRYGSWAGEEVKKSAQRDVLKFFGLPLTDESQRLV